MGCCVNPAHLEPVTPAENTRRGELHRKVRLVCSKGHSLEAGGAYPSKSKLRICRVCNKEYQFNWRKKRKEQNEQV